MRQNQYGVVLMLDALLVNLGWRHDVDATRMTSYEWVQVFGEIRNRFGIRYFPYWFLRICFCWDEFSGKGDGADDLASVLASFASFRVVFDKPFTFVWSRNGRCFFFCFCIIVSWVVFRKFMNGSSAVITKLGKR